MRGRGSLSAGGGRRRKGPGRAELRLPPLLRPGAAAARGGRSAERGRRGLRLSGCGAWGGHAE